jgi:hypothetical protein
MLSFQDCAQTEGRTRPYRQGYLSVGRSQHHSPAPTGGLTNVPPSIGDNLRSDIQPACPHDNSVMAYEATYLAMRDFLRTDLLERFLPSYACAQTGCTARFRHTVGYFTLKGSPESPTIVPIPGVNIAKCPTHGYWLYMGVRSESGKDVAWCCPIRGCEHVQHSSDMPGNWAR